MGGGDGAGCMIYKYYGCLLEFCWVDWSWSGMVLDLGTYFRLDVSRGLRIRKGA
jgi:hypothetical protein